MNNRRILSAEWFNLANHVGDAPLAVAGNRDLLRESLPARVSCQWLEQVHGNEVVLIESTGSKITADGLVTQEADIACCILTADCLPILFSNQAGTEIAAAHGGWRGLQAGILQNVVESMESNPEEIIAWFGPAIGPCHYQVGTEIRDAFLETCAIDEADSVRQCFTDSDEPEKLQLDLYAIARIQLEILGVSNTHGGTYCTHCDKENFYSYRRDGESGRMASIIFMTEAD